MNDHFRLTRFPQFAVALIAACAIAGCATYSKCQFQKYLRM